MRVGKVEQRVGVARAEIGDAILVVLFAPLLDGVDELNVALIGVLGNGGDGTGAPTLLERRDGGVVEGKRGAEEAAVEEEAPRHVVERVALGEVFGAVHRILAPVLIEVELAVAGRVLEGPTVDLDDLVEGKHAERTATFLGDADPAVAHLFAFPLGLDVVAVGLDGVGVCAGGLERGVAGLFGLLDGLFSGGLVSGLGRGLRASGGGLLFLLRGVARGKGPEHTGGAGSLEEIPSCNLGHSKTFLIGFVRVAHPSKYSCLKKP